GTRPFWRVVTVGHRWYVRRGVVRLSPAQLAPLRLPGFRNLSFATLGSSAGTLLAAVALAIDVKDRTASSPHSGLWVAAVLVVDFLPTIAVGPLVGGVLTAIAGPSAAYGINAASVVISIALVVRIPARLLQSERALSRGHWSDLRDGFSAALHSPSMRAVLVGWGIASVAAG